MRIEVLYDKRLAVKNLCITKGKKLIAVVALGPKQKKGDERI